ncbi:hypothetical protein QTP86_006539 [Hemibagrus guttatus]|nr:hypothetical protein QTP86_006539 [Hemibagrus guttatus]
MIIDSLGMKEMIKSHHHYSLSLKKQILSHDHDSLALKKMIPSHHHHSCGMKKQILSHHHHSLSLKKMIPSLHHDLLPKASLRSAFSTLSMTGLVVVWGGISMEGRTDLYRLDNGTLTAIKHYDEILGPIVRPYTGAVGPGFLLMHDNARPHVARVYRQFLKDEGIDTIEWPPRSSDLNPIEHLWDVMFWSI